MANESEATLLLKIKETGSEAISKTGEALAGLGKIATAAYATIATGVAAALHAWHEQETASNALNQALIQQGIYTKALSDQYQAYSSELQKVTTYGDEQITAAEAVIQSYIGQTKITKDLIKATLDFATAQKMDLSSAAELVGKTIGGTTNVLKRQGIEIDENQTKTDKYAEVILKLNSKFGGQAEAAAQGTGTIIQMKNAMGDILEVVGERLTPVVEVFTKDIIEQSEALQKNQSMIHTLDEVLKFFVQTAVVAKGTLNGLGSAIGATLGTSVEAVSQLIRGNFRMAWESVKSGFSGMTSDVKSNYEKTSNDLDKISQAFSSMQEHYRQNDLKLIEKSKQREVELEKEKNQQIIQDFDAKSLDEIAKQIANEEFKKNLKFQKLNAEIAAEKDYTKKLELEFEKRKLLDQAYFDKKQQLERDNVRISAILDEQKKQQTRNTLNQLSSMQSSQIAGVVAIAKAAAIANIIMSTQENAAKAISAFAFIPFIGPALGYAAAGAMIAYGAERVASISGILPPPPVPQLAEGGIVRARPGGTMALIGEAGQDEAVIPLPKNGSGLGMGGPTINITVNGGLLGDETDARKFAVVIDQQLLNLRRSNQSLAFEGVTS